MIEKRYKKICTLCGDEYEYCKKCGKFKHMEPWHDAYCSEKCHSLYDILAGFKNNWMTPEMEAARLAELDLNDEYIAKLPTWAKDSINELKKIDTKNAAAIMQALSEEKISEDNNNDKEEKIEPVKSDDTNDDSKKQQNHTKNVQYKNNKPKYQGK